MAWWRGGWQPVLDLRRLHDRPGINNFAKNKLPFLPLLAGIVLRMAFGPDMAVLQAARA